MNDGEHQRRRTRSRRAEQGQATVELALVLPVIVLLALIVLQVGLVATDQLLVQHAAREGARAAAVEPTSAAATSAVSAANKLAASRTSTQLTGGTDRGDRLTVTVTYRSPTDVPLVGRLVGDVTLTGQVTMRVE